MKTNVGATDRNVRIVVGAILILVGIAGYVGLVGLAWLGIGQALAGVVAVVIGLVLLATGLARSCPLYSLFGTSTAK